jgi:hypothetical protein
MPIVLPGVIYRMVTDGLLEVTKRGCTNGAMGHLWLFACRFDPITVQKKAQIAGVGPDSHLFPAFRARKRDTPTLRSL